MASSNGNRSGSGRRNQTTSRRSTSGKKNTSNSRSRAKQSEPMDIAIRNEIVLISLSAICILLFLCNFHLIGSLGNSVSAFMFGLFGLIAYVVPIILFFAIAFGISNEGNIIATRKLVAGLILCLLIMIVCELVSVDYPENAVLQVKDIYERCMESGKGGGVIGGMLAFGLVHFFGVKGAVLISMVVAVICLIVITDKSFLQGVSSRGKRVYERTMEDKEYRRERMEERRRRQSEVRKEQERIRKERAEKAQNEKREKEEVKENEKILRMDKRVTGVMLDTALSKEPTSHTAVRGRDDIHEIMLDNHDEYEGNGEAVSEAIPYTEYRHMIETTNTVHEIHAINFADTEEENIYQKDLTGEELTEEELTGEEVKEPQLFRREPIDVAIHKDGKTYGAKKEIVTSEHMEESKPIAKKEQPQVVQVQQTAPKVVPAKKYVLPPINLLTPGKKSKNGDSEKELRETASRLQQTLTSFGVKATITDISQGPSVTRYELQPEQGVKVSKIVGLADDIKLNLAATDIRIEAPIPGKAAVGIEVPNKENASVALRELLESKEYKNFDANLAFAVGKDIGGQTVVTDIAKMPHMLIAGATGSGKSVCINTIIMSILYKAHPDDVKLIMIDPKVVELSVYNGIPHLLIPVVTDPKKAASALRWGVAEMTERYKKFADYNVRDLKGFNQKAASMREAGEPGAQEKMPQILIIVDELADLMMVAPGEVEEAICRLAQLARAAGIHLIIATQRPSVDVITGLIKANMPSRVAFAVSSGVDSRTILDMNGAEKLLGKGDMLFYPQGYPKPARIQGAFVSDKEVSDVVDYLKNQAYVSTYGEDVEEQMSSMATQAGGSDAVSDDTSSEYDQYFVEAGRFIIEKEKASIGMLQRAFKIGFNRAARIMDQLCEAGVVGEEEGTKPRRILMNMEQFDSLINN